MKKLILTLVICIGVLSVRASYLPSTLTIRMWDHSLISVVFDGNSYNQANTSFTFSNVAGGSHFLKVFRYSHNSQGMSNNFSKLVFSGYISLASGKSISGMINNYGRFVVLSEYSMIPPESNFNGNHHGGPHHDNHYGGGYSGYNGADHYANDYNYEPVGMSEYDFGALRSMVARTSFDDTKLTLCKQAVSSNSVTSSQVRDLMTMLTFESSKLELAKFAYRNVVDKSRYYIVNSAFTFSSSIDELNRSILSY